MCNLLLFRLLKLCANQPPGVLLSATSPTVKAPVDRPLLAGPFFAPLSFSLSDPPLTPPIAPPSDSPVARTAAALTETPTPDSVSLSPSPPDWRLFAQHMSPSLQAPRSHINAFRSMACPNSLHLVKFTLTALRESPQAGEPHCQFTFFCSRFLPCHLPCCFGAPQDPTPPSRERIRSPVAEKCV
jgi:hypothetical protein